MATQPHPLPTRPRTNARLHAAGLAVIGFTFWVLSDTSLKVAAGWKLPAYEVIGLLGLLEAVLLVGYGLLRRDTDSLRPRRMRPQLLRSGLDLTNNLCVLIALRHLTLPLFYILVFFAPVVTTALSALVLRELLGWRQTLAVLLGFLGVVLAVDPLHLRRSGDWVGYLACAVCVAAFSTNITWSRVLTQTEPPLSLTLVSSLVTAVIGGLFTLHHVVAIPWHVTALLSVTALFCILGSTCFFIALRRAPAAYVAQFHYSQLLTGTLLAYLIWRDTLTPWMLAGAVLIVGTGCYTAARKPHEKGRLEDVPA